MPRLPSYRIEGQRDFDQVRFLDALQIGVLCSVIHFAYDPHDVHALLQIREMFQSYLIDMRYIQDKYPNWIFRPLEMSCLYI